MQGKMTSVGAETAVYAGIDVCKAWLDPRSGRGRLICIQSRPRAFMGKAIRPGRRFLASTQCIFHRCGGACSA
jgi:hypothetical protein